MRLFILLLAFSIAAWSQALTEAAAAAAGGSAAGVAGKKVSEGVGSILDRVAATAAKAADDKQAKAAPPLQIGQGVPKPAAPTTGTSKPTVVRAAKPDRSLVPPPPPPAHVAAVKVEPPPMPPPVVEVIAPPPPPPPPPPVVTVDDLKTLSNGTDRAALLKLGAPASQVMMAESGHLLEIYSYASHDHNFGVVRLNDGLVSSVEIKP